jgi:DNA-binding transcriptional regulator GbsR (MarR family)
MAEGKAGKMYKQGSALYVALNKVADPDTRIVEITNLTEFAVAEIKMSRGSVGQVIKRLQAMGCVEYSKGNINRKAVISLIEPPTERRWVETAGGLTHNLDYASVQRAVKDLREQIGGINVTRAFTDLADEISLIKTRLDVIEETFATFALDNSKESV